jgi:hypothetical protein
MSTRLSPEDQQMLMRWPEIYRIPIFPANPVAREIHYDGWKEQDFSKVDFRKEMLDGKYDNGAAARTGPTLSKDIYSIALDFDHWDAVIAWFGSWDNVVAHSKKSLVEWHKNQGKIHVVLFANEPIPNKKIYIGPNKALLEIRCDKQALFISPSPHRDGNKYEPLGTTDIITLQSNSGLLQLKAKIDSLSAEYMSGDDKQRYHAWLDDDSTIIGEGEGRHDATKAIICSYFWKYSGEWLNLSDDERFNRAWQWHNKHCVPPRTRQHFDDICKWVIDNHRVKRDQKHETIRAEREAQKQQQENQSPKITRFKSYPSAVQSVLQDKRWIEIGIDPPKWIIADNESRMTYKAHQYDYEIHDRKSDVSQRIYQVSKDSIALKCIPIKVVKHENPLEYFSKDTNYTIQFKDVIGKTFTLTRKTIEQIVNYLSGEGYIMPGYTSPDKLIGSLVTMFREDEQLVTDQSINTMGIYWINNELVKIGLEEYLDHYFKGYLTNERKLEAINCIDKLVSYFRPGLVSCALKIGVVSPFDFALKQYTNDIHWIPTLFTFGWPRTGKTSISSMEAGLYFAFMTQSRKKPFASVNTEARLGHFVSIDTMPAHIFELKGLNSKKDPKISTLLDMFKSIIETQEARSTMNNQSNQSTIYPSLRHLAFSSNPPPPNDIAFRSRLIMKNFTHDDVHTEEQKRAFHEFIGLNINKLRILGDFAIGYIIEHPEVLFKQDIKEIDWEMTAKEIITKLYESAGRGRPTWLDDSLKDNVEDENYETDEMNNVAGSLRTVLLNYFNELYNKYSKTLTKTIQDSYGKDIDPTAHDVSLRQRIDFCIGKDVATHFKISARGSLIVYHSILGELEKAGIETDNIGSLKQLAQILDLEYGPLKVTNTIDPTASNKDKTLRCVHGKIHKLHQFLEGEGYFEEA